MNVKLAISTAALAALTLLTAACSGQNAVLVQPVHQQFLDRNGKPLAGGKLYTCVAGTTCPGNPQATYQDAAATVANPNPITLDSTGYATIRTLANKAYKFAAFDKNNVQQWVIDNVGANQVFQKTSTAEPCLLLNGNFCAVNVSWPMAFVDSSYTPICSIANADPKEFPSVVNIQNITATGLTVYITTTGASGLVSNGQATVYCTAWHD